MESQQIAILGTAIALCLVFAGIYISSFFIGQ